VTNRDSVKVKKKQEPDYLAYLLRLWRVSRGENSQLGKKEPVWRAALESPGTHEQIGFDNLDALFEFLRQQTSGVVDGMADGDEA
jgi:hypothetical protein